MTTVIEPSRMRLTPTRPDHRNRFSPWFLTACIVTATVLSFGPAGPLPQACAQDPNNNQTSDDQPGVKVSVAPAGVQRFTSEGWASIAVVGQNTTDEDVEETVSVFAGEAPNLQFSTTFWLPAHSKRQTWLPIKLPPAEMTGNDRVELSMIRIAESEGEETFNENQNDMPVFKRSLMLVNNEINTGLIFEMQRLGDSTDRETRRLDLMNVINAARDSTTTDPSDLPVINFYSNFLPPTHGALDQMDQVVIAGDHLLGDSRAISAVRSWIRGGGRAWIMLDRTSQRFVDELLGDDVPYSVINETELNDLQIEYVDPFTRKTGLNREWTSETPAKMFHVVTDAEDVACRVNGWPAAFWTTLGDGEVLFTTLDAQGWVRNGGGASTALNQLARRFFEPKNEPSQFVEAMLPIVDDRIGYQIPSRGLATLILSLNALVILIAGAYWARKRQLERMAILVPATAITTTIIMLSIGAHHAGSVPSTVATSQVIRIHAATDDADVSTVRAVYSQRSGDLGLVATKHSLPMPIDDDGTSQTRRVRFDDKGSSRWSGPDQPPGVVRHLVSKSSVELSDPIRVRGTFDSDGFRGTLVGLDGAQCQDGLIAASPAPMTAVAFEEEGSGQVVAKASDRLAPDQFVPGAMLSDQQRIRQGFLRNVFQSTQQHSLGEGPALIVWTAPIDLGVQFADRFNQNGEALISIPIQIEPPKSGQDFLVPASFIRTDTFMGEQGRSTIFDPNTGKWVADLTKADEIELIFRFPDALSSMKLQSVDVSMKVSAASRTFFVKALGADGPQTVFDRDNATGLIEFTIDQKDALQIHPDGGLWLSFGVTETFQATELRAAQGNSNTRIVDNSTWQIDYVHLDVVGQIEPTGLTSDGETPVTNNP